MSQYHVSVLLSEVIDYLQIKPQHRYIDATLGGGGHTREILLRGGMVLGIDSDQDAINHNKDIFENEKNITIAQGNFRNLETIAHLHGFNTVSGILFDLGVSSYQLDTAERGFSFQKDAILDMRMDPQLGVTAADLVNGLGKKELYELFTKYGEEPFAHVIANNIIQARRSKKIETTRELAYIIEKSVGKFSEVHPATRVFQALRIAVNDELNSLKDALPQALELLEKGGRLVIISFHSLEDRIVKDYFKELAGNGKGNILTEKPVMAHEEEVSINRRSRSAKLRVLEKI